MTSQPIRASRLTGTCSVSVTIAKWRTGAPKCHASHISVAVFISADKVTVLAINILGFYRNWDILTFRLILFSRRSAIFVFFIPGTGPQWLYTNVVVVVVVRLVGTGYQIFNTLKLSNFATYRNITSATDWCDSILPTFASCVGFFYVKS